MEKENKMMQVQTRFTNSEYEQIQNQARLESRSISNLIHTVMMNYLEDQIKQRCGLDK